MTHVLSRARATTTRDRRAGVGALPAVLTLVVVVACLLRVETPVLDIGRYALYLGWAVLLPGVLVHRALRGRQPSLLEDLALGGATGLCLGLAAWAVALSAGVPDWLWAWPVVVVAPFAAVPRLRQHWRPGGHLDADGTTPWVLALSVTVYTLAISASMGREPLPPRANNYYIDQYWHIANAAELTRRLPPDVPSVAGRTLRYHWFANADVAQAHLISGVDLPTVYLRLWSIPVVVIVLGLVVALTRRLCGARWPGAVAALLVVVPGTLDVWSWYTPWSLNALPNGSPSQLYGLVPLLLALHVLVGLVRGERAGGGWVVLVMASLVAPGSKPSVLPVLLAGTGLVLLAALWRHRDRVRAVLPALLLLGSTTVLLGPLVAQATAASGVKLFGLLAFVPGWTDVAPRADLPSTGGLTINGLGDPRLLAIAVVAVLTIALQLGFALPGLVLLGRETRGDLALLLVGGCVVAAIGATVVVDHSGASEIYFARTAAPCAAVLGAWGLHRATVPARETAPRTVAVVVAGAVVVGVVSVLVGSLVGRSQRAGSLGAYLLDLVLPLIAVAVVAALAVVGWHRLRSRRPDLLGLGPTVVTTAVVAAFLVQGPAGLLRTLEPGTPPPEVVATRAETQAARWVAANVPRDAVMATNVHCREGRTVPNCDSRAYWVPALTERRQLVESWAYTEENLRRIGEFNAGFPLFPFDDPALLAENDAVFTAPTQDRVRALRDDHGVTWLFAVERAGPVSSRLDDLADLRFSNDAVRVYQLRTSAG